MIPAFRKNAGFSLIELAILIAIVGLLGGALMTSYNQWARDAISGNNNSRRDLVSNALTLFLTTYGRLPCPADPALAPGATNAGYEICPDNYAAAVPVTGCNIAASATPTLLSGNVCRVLGGRDTTADADSVNDPVLIGTVPYAALGLSVKDTLDAWNDKMTYAVSEYLTNAKVSKGPIYNDSWGVITMTELVLNQTTHAELGVFPKLAGPVFQVVFLSHGADGKGAYDYNGKLIKPCTGVARDVENCNGDATFLSADKGQGTGIYNTVPGAKFFDDAFLVYQIRRDSDKWNSTAGGMQNKTGAHVGINNNSPSTELDVGGNLKASPNPTDITQKGDVSAMSYCSEDVAGNAKNCFVPTIISGPIDDSNPAISAAHCGTSTSPALMQGIDGAAIWKTKCNNTLSTLLISPSSCPAGTFMTGIDALGGIVCKAP